MANKEQKDNNKGFPILAEVNIPYDLIVANLGEKSRLVDDINYNVFKNFYEVLRAYADSDAVFYHLLNDFRDNNTNSLNLFKTMLLSSDQLARDTLYFSPNNFYTLLAYSLNIPDDVLQKSIDKGPVAVFSLLDEKIEVFKQIKTFNQLKANYQFLFEQALQPARHKINTFNQVLDSNGINENSVKNLSRKQRDELSSTKSGRKVLREIDDYPIIGKIKPQITNIDNFVEAYSAFFKSIEKIAIQDPFTQRQIPNIEIDRLPEDEKLIIKLLGALSILEKNITEGFDDKDLLYIKDFLNTYGQKYPADFKIKYPDIFINDGNQITTVAKSSDQFDNIGCRDFTFKEIFDLCSKAMETKNYLRDVSVPTIDYNTQDKEKVKEIVEKLVKIAKEKGLYIETSKEDAVKQYEEVLKQTSGSKNMAALRRKINFFLNNQPIQWIHTITGDGTFKNYRGYIYPNGYVVLEYFPTRSKKHKKEHYNTSGIYGKGLYLMKLDDYNDLKSSPLSDISKDPRAVLVRHTASWEKRLVKYLESYKDIARATIPDKIKKIATASSIEELYEMKRKLLILIPPEDNRRDDVDVEVDKRKKQLKDLQNEQVIAELRSLSDSLNPANVEYEKRIIEKENRLLETKIDDATSVSQLNEIENSTNNITKENREKIRNKKLKFYTDIDREITEKSKNITSEDYACDPEELAEEEEKFLADAAKSNVGTDFASRYNYEKEKEDKQDKPKKKTGERLLSVSTTTKERTKDKDGYFCCDLCGAKDRSIANFRSHHIIPLSEGGPDNIYNTTCLCPSCHARIHNYLKLRKKLDSGEKDNLPEGSASNYITMTEYGKLLNNTRRRIANNTPEFLPNFEELFNPNYSGESRQKVIEIRNLIDAKKQAQLESQEELERQKAYEQNKNNIDMNFSYNYHSK